MAVGVTGGSARTPLGGAARSLDMENTIRTRINTNQFITGMSTGAQSRYGAVGDITVAFPQGALSGAQARGFRAFQGAMCQFISGDGAGAAMCYQYSEYSPSIIDVRPPSSLVGYDAYLVWEVRGIMGITTTGAITRDVGIVLVANTGVTGWAGCMRVNEGGNDYGGVGLVFDTDGSLRFIAKNVQVPAALSISTVVDSPALGLAIGTLVPFRILLVSATPTADAFVQIWTRGVSRLTVPWGTGTLLPTPASLGNVGAGEWLRTFRPNIRNCQVGAAVTTLNYRSVRIIAAESIEALG